MSFDAFTITAIIVSAIIIGVLVRLCNSEGNACNAPNEFLDKTRDKSDDHFHRGA